MHADCHRLRADASLFDARSVVIANVVDVLRSGMRRTSNYGHNRDNRWQSRMRFHGNVNARFHRFWLTVA